MKTRRMMLSVVWIIVSVLIFVACEKKEEEKKYISISSQKEEVSCYGRCFYVRVNANASWTAIADQPWVTIYPNSGGATEWTEETDSCTYYYYGYKIVEICVDENTTFVQDTAHVVFSIGTKFESVSCTVIRRAKTP